MNEPQKVSEAISAAYVDGALHHLEQALQLLELAKNKRHAVALIDVMVDLLEEKKHQVNAI
jgi:hypothetical protein